MNISPTYIRTVVLPHYRVVFQENLLTDPAAPPPEVENPQVFSPSPSFGCPSSTSLSPSGAGRRETPKLIAPPGGSDVTVASLSKEAVTGQRGGGGGVTRRLQVVRSDEHLAVGVHRDTVAVVVQERR